MFGPSPHHDPAISLHGRPAAFTWLLCALMLVILPHVTRMPLWITCTALCLCLYRLMHDHMHWRLPSRGLGVLCALLLAGSILVSFGVPPGRRAAIAFLIVLLGLKLLETRTQRDVMVLSCIGYFLVMTNFLYSQSITMVVYLLVIVWLLTVALIHFQHLGDINRTSLRLTLRQGSLLLVQALPLMVVLFIFFPRIEGSLWGVPEDGGAGVTGFSDHMSPGQVAELSTSTAVAFRVEFDGDPPPTDLQYWRGLVLWDFDGYTWRPGPPLASQPMQWHGAGTIYTYTVTLEPHGSRWLFSLDLPYAFRRNGRTFTFDHAGYYNTLGTLTNDFQLRAKRPVSNLRRYTLQSVAHYHTGNLDDTMRRRALRLPHALHAGVRQLALQWRRASRSDRDVVQQAVRYFHTQPFVYTLSPPALEANPTYEFLFETQRGYCEHFASSFTVLMRAAGVPARVVIGYQGSEVNPLGQHLTVRQSNAHAWAEVWLERQGWVRVDPTAAVAPERIELGLDGVPELSPIPLIIRNSTWLHKLWRSTRLSWDALHHVWNRWVLQYSSERQTQLMTQIGLGELSWQGLTTVLVMLLSLMLTILALRLFRRHPRRDRVVLAYQKFCRKLARRGMTRKSHEGPSDFAQRVQRQRPELTAPVDFITRLYSALRYGQHQSATDTKRLQHAVRAFHP